MIRINNIEMALSGFENAAINHEDASKNGDYKTANKNYKTIAKSIAYLRDNDAIFNLSKLLNHPSLGVRTWSATYLLPVSEKEAVTVLKGIAKGNGIQALDAETVLSEWEKGNLKL